MNMKKVLIGVVIGLLIAVFFVQSNSQQEPNSIKLGAIMSQTGKLASAGEKIGNAIILAVEELNARGDHEIELIMEDSLSELDTAVSAAQKLISIDGTKIIIGPVRSNNTLAVAPFAEQSEVILFTPSSSAEDITNAGDFVFRNRESAKSHGIGMADFMFERNIRKAAVLVANGSNSLTYAEHFRTRFEELGGEVVEWALYDENVTDFRSEITKVKDSGAEAAYASVATGKDAGLLVKQLSEASFTGLVGGSAAMNTQEYLDGAGVAAEGVVFTQPLFAPEEPVAAHFVDAYEERFGSTPDVYAANGYDAVKILYKAIEACGSTDTYCIRDSLYATKNFPGAGGLTTFDKNGDVIKPVTFLTVEFGEFVQFTD